MQQRLGLFLAGALSCIFCAFLGSAPAQATESGHLIMSINPSEQEIDLKPGTSQSGSVTVYNVGSDTFSFDVEAASYQTVNDDYDPDFNTENSYTKLKNWISFPETHFTVEPDHAVEVKFQIDVPEDVAGGGQYAAIFFRASDPTVSDDNPIQLVAQLASLIYGHIDGDELRIEGELSRHSLPSLMLGDEFKATSVFENTGNVDFRVTETLTIRDLFTNREVMNPNSATDNGQLVGTIEATVLPGTSRTINMFWQDAPQLGFFRVTQTIAYLDENLTIEKVVFICPIWLVVLVGIFVVLIIIWIISRIRARRQNQPQVF